MRAVWGERALINRCVFHKARNVLEKVIRAMQGLVKRRLARAWGEAEAAAAALSLQALADRLAEAACPQAAASLREAFEETFTFQRLQLPDWPRRSLRSTNIIDPIFARPQELAHRRPRCSSTFGVSLPRRRPHATGNGSGPRYHPRRCRRGKGGMAAARRHGAPGTGFTRRGAMNWRSSGL